MPWSSLANLSTPNICKSELKRLASQGLTARQLAEHFNSSIYKIRLTAKQNDIKIRSYFQAVQDEDKAQMNRLYEHLKQGGTPNQFAEKEGVCRTVVTARMKRSVGTYSYKVFVEIMNDKHGNKT